MADPILVIHGVGNRDEQAFRDRVAHLEQAFAGRYRFKPVYWGDLGANSDFIDDTLPVLEEVRAVVDQIDEKTIRAIAFGLLASSPVPVRDDGGEVRSDRAVTAARAELVAVAASGQSVSSGAQPPIRAREPNGLPPGLAAEVHEAVVEQFPNLTWLPQIADAEVLAMVGRTVGQAVGDQPAPGSSREEVRGVEVRKFVKNRLHELDVFTGSLIGKVGASLNDTMRRQRGEGIARFLGDVFVYQRHRDAIHNRVRKAAGEIGTGAGNAERPVQVIGHSLGGVIAFDLAVAADPPLHTKALLTFGSQSPLFHIIDPRSTKLAAFTLGTPVQLPATLSSWRNLWEPMDPLAFVAEKVFRLADSSPPEDTPVAHMASFGLWTHSVYWKTEELLGAIRDTFE
jgi:hypothetical protein